MPGQFAGVFSRIASEWVQSSPNTPCATEARPKRDLGSVFADPADSPVWWNPPVERDPTASRLRPKAPGYMADTVRRKRAKVSLDKAMRGFLQLLVAPTKLKLLALALLRRQFRCASCVLGAAWGGGDGGSADTGRAAPIWRGGGGRLRASGNGFRQPAGAGCGMGCSQTEKTPRAPRHWQAPAQAVRPGTLPMKSRLPNSTPLWRRIA
jgi:hypothetical protein